ncbi:MAG TPA: phosphatidylglycerol lysyltransferase domain-containing protein [Solirubrobacteraceae bacterium]|nr:phosphatidylglycerol lysyltransferase domain-containing protein [Solirubrobacteraceae bacterium]
MSQETADGHTVSEHIRAAALVAAHGCDSLDPFALREDKRFHFAGGGMLAFRVIRGTAVISGDPIGPEGSAAEVLRSFAALAERSGWTLALTGASEHHLRVYEDVGLRAVQMGSEAVVDPRRFTLEGRPVRKVRQSVARIARRGWSVEVREAGELARDGLSALEAIERDWRATQPRVVGFAMTLGKLWAPDEERGDGLYVLARNPDGELCSFLHFVRYEAGLSLDVMRRRGEEPNGLNEAMVVAALEHARAAGMREVSLNFAGCAHLMAPHERPTLRRRVARFALRRMHGRFQLERLMRFNEKFFPTWRPRYLVYAGRARLPLAALRVLQAEGYVRAPAATPLRSARRPAPNAGSHPMPVARSAASR